MKLQKLWKTYEQPMREAARRSTNHRILREGAEPQTGVYYWIPLPDGKWDMMSFFDSTYVDLMHERVWKTEVTKYLIKLWAPTTIHRDFNLAYAGLPRGRIVRLKTGYVNYCGGDTPLKNLDAILRKEFGLPNIRSIADDHEHTLPTDVRIVNSTLQSGMK